MKLRTLLLTAVLGIPIAAHAAITQQPCPAPPVCNTQAYSFSGTITPTKVAQAVAKCIDWREGNNTADKDQCFGAFQDIISLQDCDAAAFNYLYYNPGCSPKPVR